MPGSSLPCRVGALATCCLAAVMADRPATAGPPGQSPPRKAWRPAVWIQHAGLAECSGIVASRQYPGIFWAHGDSGNPAVLYAITVSGELVAEVPVLGAPNIDWEDIAADDKGHLYIADTGNNFNIFPMRSIYQVDEPDPRASPVKPARVVRRYKYTYPGKRFDSEALFVRGDRLWIVSKPKGGRAAIYRLDPVGEAGAGQQSNSKHQLVETAVLTLGSVTGADLSPDGKRLALCTGASLRVYSVDKDGAPLAGEQPAVVRYPHGMVEAVCFDGEDVVLVSERGEVYRITAADLAAGTHFVRPDRLE